MPIIKAISGKSPIRTVLTRVMDKRKTSENLLSGWNCTPFTVKDEMEVTKRLWGKNGGRTYKHFIQSFAKDENISPEQAHQIAHLVHLIILPAQVFCVAEHLIPQVRLHLSSRAEDRYPPQETAEDDGKDDADHGHADPVQQERHIKGHLYAVFHNVSLIQSIDDQLINFRHLQLQVVHGKQRQQPRQQSQRVLAVIDVDMLAENQENSFSSLLGCI